MAERAPVLVAGAGPVGLTLALALARRGVQVRVFERRTALSTASRASTIHPPTLEVLSDLGVLEEVLPLGQKVERIGHFTLAEGLVADFPLSLLAQDTALPFRFHLEQALLTPVLLDRLRARPEAEVAFEAELVGIEQDEASGAASALVRTARGVERVAARLVVGADGAHSTVRAAAGIPTDDAPYGHRVLRLMTAAPLEQAVPRLAPISYIHDTDATAGRGMTASISLLRMREVWRVIIRIPPDLADGAAMDHGYWAPIVRHFLPGALDPLPVVSADVYGVSKRMALRYREGRALLVGDAAHLTNTRGGMNMNAGIHDAATLAATLAAIDAGGPEDALLAAWAEARAGVAARALLPRSDRAVSDAGWIAHVRAEAADPARARQFLIAACMLDIARIGAPPGGSLA